jgi:thiamine pyrophosphate-dependent acetolactate synthase large subunit-like protein
LGWGAPAAVGVVKRPVVAVIGDDAFEYSIQCLYTAAQHKLPVVFVVVRNGEYGVLKDFAVLEKARRTYRVSTSPVLIFQRSPKVLAVTVRMTFVTPSRMARLKAVSDQFPIPVFHPMIRSYA